LIAVHVVQLFKQQACACTHTQTCVHFLKNLFLSLCGSSEREQLEDPWEYHYGVKFYVPDPNNSRLLKDDHSRRANDLFSRCSSSLVHLYAHIHTWTWKLEACSCLYSSQSAGRRIESWLLLHVWTAFSLLSLSRGMMPSFFPLVRSLLWGDVCSSAVGCVAACLRVCGVWDGRRGGSGF